MLRCVETLLKTYIDGFGPGIPNPISGYVHTKVVRLTPGKPQMTIAHFMRNTDSKPIATNVYNHNFHDHRHAAHRS